jgi:hypothetical protein
MSIRMLGPAGGVRVQQQQQQQQQQQGSAKQRQEKDMYIVRRNEACTAVAQKDDCFLNKSAECINRCSCKPCSPHHTLAKPSAADITRMNPKLKTLRVLLSHLAASLRGQCLAWSR